MESLKRLFKSSLDRGPVTLAQTEKLLAAVKKDGVSGSERRQLREQFLANEDRFDPAGAARMKDFIAREIPNLLVDDNVGSAANGRRNLPDPALPAANAVSIRYQWTAGTLIKDGVSKDDVIQGMLGNCNVMAAIAAVAAQQPKRIEEMIKDHGDGTYTVHFHDLTAATPTRVPITVDGQLPTRNGGLEFGKNRDRTELWVGVMEKAYAQWKGGYDVVGKGGSLQDALSALTGRVGGVIPVAPGDEKDTFEVAEYALKAGLAVAAATKGEDQEALYKGTAVYAGHGYSVLGVSKTGAETFITLRNPWGEVEPAGDGVDDGVFTLSMTRFLELFHELYIS